MPPLASSVTAVIPRASCEARNATTSAISVSCPSRPMAIIATMFSSRPGALYTHAPISVSMTPGVTVFTVIPRAPNAWASVRLKASITALFIV